MTLLMEERHAVKGLDPVADAFAGTVYSDVVDLSEYASCLFTIYAGVGATGTSTITVNACDDIAATTEVAVPFYYRQTTVGASDTEGAVTLATATGFLTTAGSGRLVQVEVTADQLVSTGYRYVRAKFVEGTDSPVLGGVLIELGKPRYRNRIAASAID